MLRRRFIARSSQALAAGSLLGQGRVWAEPVSRETRNLQFAFLYSITKFCRWPKSVEDGEGPFRLGVVGEDTFDLTAEVRSRLSFRARPLVVASFRDELALTNMLLLFVGEKTSLSEPLDLAGLHKAGVLTINDVDATGKLDCAMQFRLSRGRVRLGIHRGHCKAAGVTVSAKLLGLADILD